MQWAGIIKKGLLLVIISSSIPVILADSMSQAEYNWLMAQTVVPATRNKPPVSRAPVRRPQARNSQARRPQVRRPQQQRPQAKPRVYPTAAHNGNMLRQLPWQVRQVFQRSNVDTNNMGAFVLRIGDRQPMLAFNENSPKAPASVMKLVTTYSALGTLGANYRWPTEVYMTGQLRGGSLNGNLIIKGYGAPDFKTADLRQILQQLRRKGVRNFSGNVVFDNSYFQVPNINPGSFDGKRYETYNAQPDALLFNEKTSEFIVQNVRGRATIYTPTPAHNVRIVNKIRTVKSRCRGRARSPRMSVSSNTTGHVVTFSGRFSRRCGKRTYKRAITDAPSMIFASMQRLWKTDVGGHFNARFVRGRTPGNARLLHRHQSAPLSQIIQEVNKDSNNLMARQIMLTIGARKLGAPSNPRKSEQAIKQWLASKGLKFGELRIENGSGLSRWSRISARHVGELLLHAYRSPYRQYLYNSLAVAGRDGTIKKRFRNTPVAGKGRFKTGSLKDARAIAGYVRGVDGRDYIVSILHNGTAARRRGKKAHDALIEWAYWRGNPPQHLAKR
jgi:D-alanyl-D-alanine carboxypeptidase/D-alanyl-D-alanine-endopeptidase (penicillin-binding protein 4)